MNINKVSQKQYDDIVSVILKDILSIDDYVTSYKNLVFTETKFSKLNRKAISSHNITDFIPENLRVYYSVIQLWIPIGSFRRTISTRNLHLIGEIIDKQIFEISHSHYPKDFLSYRNQPWSYLFDYSFSKNYTSEYPWFHNDIYRDFSETPKDEIQKWISTNKGLDDRLPYSRIILYESKIQETSLDLFEEALRINKFSNPWRLSE